MDNITHWTHLPRVAHCQLRTSHYVTTQVHRSPGDGRLDAGLGLGPRVGQGWGDRRAGVGGGGSPEWGGGRVLACGCPWPRPSRCSNAYLVNQLAVRTEPPKYWPRLFALSSLRSKSPPEDLLAFCVRKLYLRGRE